MHILHLQIYLAMKNHLISASQICLEQLKLKFINWYLREDISITKNDTRDWDQSNVVGTRKNRLKDKSHDLVCTCASVNS